jgi:serine phosphatase RsbU (regulator of sigma subunit)
MIVDDEPGMLRSVSRVLRRDHDITTAETGEEALEKLEEGTPDLAIVDIRMPGINGFELTRRLKQHDEDLDVILMTGNAEEPDDNLIQAIDGGAFYFITKPFDRRVLLTLVNRCLELRRLRRNEQRYLERLERELDEAQKFQMSLLPPPYQTIAGVNIHARYLACSELAGDIYDYAPAGDNAVAFMVADVVGHGASAAMMTSVVKSAFHSAAEKGFVPLDVIEQVKEGIRTFDPSRFVTLTCARLDTSTGELNYVNAGHPAGILARGGSSIELLEATSPMLSSTFHDVPYKDQTVMLGDEDSVLLYTDGVTETQSGRHEMFGHDRMTSLMTDEGYRGGELLDRILHSVSEFAGSRPQLDDITLLAVGKA